MSSDLKMEGRVSGFPQRYKISRSAYLFSHQEMRLSAAFSFAAAVLVRSPSKSSSFVVGRPLVGRKVLGFHHNYQDFNKKLDREKHTLHMTTSRKDLIRKLLKGIETGDPASAAVVNEEKYIQHNPQTHEGGEGLAALFARLSKTNPRVNVVRAYEDGDYVFGMTEYEFSTSRVGFEVFRFEGNQAVEHWDNIQKRQGPNVSRRSMVDGPTEATDLELTEANREFVKSFVQDVYVDRKLEKLQDYVAADLIQHDPRMGDGMDVLRDALTAKSDDGTSFMMQYDRIHRILAEGNFALVVTEGFLNKVHTSFYNMFRVENNIVVEHWTTVEAVPPKSEWKNDNGKF